MNAPPSTLMDELDRIMQSAWTERIPNRRYARIEPVVAAATPSGNFAGELFEESQPLPISGTKAPTVSAALTVGALVPEMGSGWLSSNSSPAKLPDGVAAVTTGSMRA